MLINVLNSKIKEMKDLRRCEAFKENQAAQEAVDRRYSSLTEQLDALVVALRFAKANMSFQLSDGVINDLETLLNEHKRAVQDGYADKDIVGKVETDLKPINVSVKKEWSKHFSFLTSSTLSTLKVIYDIDYENVSQCLQGISRGENWTTDTQEFQAMNQSIDDANNLISGLGLDDQIVSFLQKMNRGKATVADLDENVMLWLNNEGLDKKVMLSFR